MTCQLHRMWINRALDDGRPVPARGERHLARCATCRRWHEQQSSVVRRLRTNKREGGVGTAASAAETAGCATEAAPPFLRSRILNEIKADPRREARPGLMRWAWAGSVVAAIALAVVLSRSGTQPAPTVIAGHEPVGARSPAAATAMLEVTTRFTDGGRLLQAATNFDQPLQKEMHLVLDDARAVLRSLQTEFIPATLLAKRD